MSEVEIELRPPRTTGKTFRTRAETYADRDAWKELAGELVKALRNLPWPDHAARAAIAKYEAMQDD